MHPNTENSIRIGLASQLFNFLLDILPLEDASGGEDDDEKKGGGDGTTEKIAFIYESVPKDQGGDIPGRQFIIQNLQIDRKSIRPFQNCFIQELERMNKLCVEIISALLNLEKASRGEMNFTAVIEATQSSLITDRIPEHWAKWSFPTLRTLSSWISLIKLRLEFLKAFTQELNEMPKIT